MDIRQFACRVECDIAFRVEFQDGGAHYNNQTLALNGIERRGPFVFSGCWLDVVDDHLSWTLTNTPFMSLFRSWERALTWRAWGIKRYRPENVVVIAVCLRGMENVYCAHTAAKFLGYEEGSEDPRRKLENHEDEVLIQGIMPESELRILAMFHGNLPWTQSVELKPVSNDNETVTVRVPYHSLVAPGQLADESANEWLRLEVFKRIDNVNEFWFCMLVLALYGSEFIVRESEGRIVVEDISSTERRLYYFVTV